MHWPAKIHLLQGNSRFRNSNQSFQGTNAHNQQLQIDGSGALGLDHLRQGGTKRTGANNTCSEAELEIPSIPNWWSACATKGFLSDVYWIKFIHGSIVHSFHDRENIPCFMPPICPTSSTSWRMWLVLVISQYRSSRPFPTLTGQDDKICRVTGERRHETAEEERAAEAQAPNGLPSRISPWLCESAPASEQL